MELSTDFITLFFMALGLKLFSERSHADYSDLKYFKKEEVEQLMEEAANVLEEIKRYIKD